MKSFNIKKKEMKTEGVASYMGTAARKGNIAFNKYMVQACMVLVTALMIIGFGVTGDAEAVLSVKQGTIVKNTAAGAQAITGVGFQPKAIIFYWTKQTATGYLASYSAGYGFAAAGAPITMAAVSIQALDNQATTDANNYHSNAAAIAIQNTASGGALNNLGTITAFGADGFTLNWSAAGQADRISYIALGGSDITNAKVGTTSMFALTGNSSVTGVGFQPNTAFLLSSINGNTLNTVTASLRTGLTFGFMSTTSGTTQGSLSIGNRDARTATGYIGGVWRNNGYTNLRATAADVQATFSTWDADGFTMNATAAPNGAHNVSWLALQGGLFKLGTLVQPTATGTQAITGLGFQPLAAIFASANLNSASGTVSTTTAKQSFGAAAATQTGQWIGSAGTINSDENMNSSSTAAITLATGPTTTNAVASLSTFDADGFTLNWTADATARNVLYVAMGTACTDADLATLTTTNPVSSSTVGGTVTIQTQVGTEATPSGMTGMVVNIAGSTGCNVTNGVMSWNAGTSRWEYTWNTSACGTGAPDAGVTIDVSGTDPDCSTTVNALQITNVTIDNTCTDSDPATAVTITPASSATVGATVTVQGAITGEGAPGTGSAAVTITGSDACNATAQAMTWNSGASVWEYSWDTSACGTAAPDTGVSVSITYTDPDCSGAVVVNNTSTNITIDNFDASAMPSCAGCHGYGATFTDGTARNNPAGTFPGSHNTHVATYSKVCSVCHTAPATETSADFKHRNETVQIASPINGLAGSTYSKTSFTQTNAAFSGGFCSNTYCHSNGTSVISGSIPANSSATWGGATTCLSCHGVGGGDDGRPNYANNTPKRNTHGDGVSYGVTHKATECDVCHTGVTGTAGAYTISDTTTHNNGAYNIQGALGYTQATGVCATPGCHGSAAWGGAALTCVECHNSAVNSPIAQGLGGPSTRSAVVGEFGLAWGHKKTGRGAVTVSDCIVCHLEGVFATQAKSATYHGDGYIDLRDPDVAGETRITNIAGTSYRFVQFSTSYAAGARTSGGATAENVDNILTQKFCLKCHDAGGAANTTARTTYGTPTNAMPFGGVALGANYTAANGAIGTQGLINVNDQFATTNSSAHPVRGPRSKDFPTAVRMNDPYKPTGTRGTSGTLTQGVVINCFDCHNTPTTPLTTRTVSAHGNAATIRGVATVTGTPAATTNQVTFCIVCHAGYDTSTLTHHNTGSALSGNTNNTMTAYLRYGCNICHGSSYTTAVVRPVRAQDVHGSSTVPTGTITKSGRWAAASKNGPIAFIRNSNVFNDHAPLNITGTVYTPVCMGGEDGVNGTQNTPACDRGFENYTVGGTY